MWWCRAALTRVCSSAAASASASASLISSRSASLISSRSYGVIPIEHTSSGERDSDIFSLLLNERIVFINDTISKNTASVVVAQLLFLDSENSKPIHLYINSPGGAINAGMTIYDTIQFIQSPVTTLCIGQAFSVASLLLAAGAPGERRALPNTRVMINQPSGIIRPSQATKLSIHKLSIHIEKILKLQEHVNALYAKHTGQSIQRIEKFMEQDMFMNPEESKEFGLIDEVIEHRPISDVVVGSGSSSGSKE